LVLCSQRTTPAQGTGSAQKEMAQQQVEQERQRAERLAARLRQMGINPDEL